MRKSALVMWGGWDGHTPKETAEILAGKLKENGFDVRIENALKPLEDVEAVKKLNLIVPMWTMGEISNEQWTGLNQAVHDAAHVGGIPPVGIDERQHDRGEHVRLIVLAGPREQDADRPLVREFNQRARHVLAVVSACRRAREAHGVARVPQAITGVPVARRLRPGQRSR